MKNKLKGFTTFSSHERGFTLVEVLVVMSILSILGVLVLYTLTGSLRGSNKAQLISSIKKNGQTALETMDKTIRSSKKVVCVSGDEISGNILSGNTLVVVSNKGVYTRFRYTALTPSANGKISRDFPGQPNDLEDINTFVGRLCTAGYIPVSSEDITDGNIKTGVSIKLPEGTTLFKKDSSAGFKDIVTISFQVDAPIGAPVSIGGQISPVVFVTTIGLR